ncbi:GNAT family N-acetyltransferase [Glycomyces sp. NPDC046736]|uniref:GNAT family N-acetyltransferase n=1 Tax=Glycomyces sp. NPDC046736 TaxID=3155615 RepID=UPI0034011F9F
MSVELKTERLILRPFAEADLEAFAAINADPEVMRYIGDGKPRDREATREGIVKSRRAWDEQGWGTFAVVETDTSDLVGFAALAVPNFLPEILPVVEVGWRIARDRWGKGYAPEAARAAIGFAFNDIGMTRLVSCIHRDNTASIRVAEKLGMTLERETTVPEVNVPCKVYELNR